MEIAKVNHRSPEMQSADVSAGIGVTSNEAISRLHHIRTDLTRQMEDIGIPQGISGNGGVDSALPAPEVADEELIASARIAFEAVDNDQARADLFAILDLLLQLKRSQRENDHATRYTGYAKQEHIQNAAADKARQAADDRMWGAIASGAAQALSGLVMIGTAFASAGSVSQGWEISPQEWQSFGQGSSSVLSSLGGAADSGFQAAAAEYDAQKAELEAAGRKQEQATQVVNEQMQLSMDSIRNLFESLRSIEQLRQDVVRGGSQRI